jgi:hypothetical protein
MRRSMWLLAAAMSVLAAPAHADDVGTWNEIQTSDPFTRTNYSAVYDVVNQRMLLFSGPDREAEIQADGLWELDPDQRVWTPLLAAGPTPPSRWGHTSIYDPIRERMLVFGGSAGFRRNDVWAYDGAAWTELVTTGTTPSGRTGAVAVYDALNDRMLVVGGTGAPSNGSVFALSLTGTPTWTPLAATGNPTLGDQHRAAYDPIRHRVIVFGAEIAPDAGSNETWALDVATLAWTQLSPGGTPPPPRLGHTMLYDPVRDRMVVFGGAHFTTRYGDVWALNLAANTWGQIVPSTPAAARFDHEAVYDAANDRMIVYGGLPSSPEVWSLSLASGTWSSYVPAGRGPGYVRNPRLLLDQVRDRMIAIGGSLAEPWVLPFDGPPRWSPFGATGTVPGPVAGYILDVHGDRIVALAPGASTLEPWTVAIDAPAPLWTPLAVSGTGPPSGRHDVVYDAVGDRLHVLSWSSNGRPSSTLWSLSLGETPTWSAVAMPGTPTGFFNDPTVAFDTERQRLFVFQDHTLGHTWQLDLAGPPVWTPLPGIPYRSHSPIVYDGVRDRLVTFGGQGTNGSHVFFDDVWALPLDGSPSWSLLEPLVAGPLPREDHGVVYDPARDRMLVFAGFRYQFWNYPFRDLHELVWGAPALEVPAEPASPATFVARPNPAHAGSPIAFDLAPGGAARFEVIDVAGRRVWSRDLSASAAARSLSWDGRDDRGRLLGPGVYHARLTGAAGIAAQRRFVRVQ